MINTRPRTWLLAGAASLAMSFGCFVRADVTGTAKLDGTAPEQKPIDMSAVAECNNLHPDPVTEENVVVNDKGMLRYVVVSVKKEDSPDLPAGEMSKEPAVIDQKGCMYSPHVQAMMVGQELKINNSDPFLHNIHSLATTNPGFNKAQSNKTPEPEKAPEQPKAAEYIRFKCDVHPWMSSCLAVFDHPYFGVSDENGKFTIKNVPDGD